MLKQFLSDKNLFGLDGIFPGYFEHITQDTGTEVYRPVDQKFSEIHRLKGPKGVYAESETRMPGFKSQSLRG